MITTHVVQQMAVDLQDQGLEIQCLNLVVPGDMEQVNRLYEEGGFPLAEAWLRETWWPAEQVRRASGVVDQWWLSKGAK